jgi:transketolase
MTDLEQRSINAIRFLSVDAVQKANSGHPGLPMGAAPMAYVLWNDFLKHNPANPQWPDRDRFILSGGHGSMLVYSLLYLTGYTDMSMDQLKNFRQYGSKTPGHPESHITPGVEATTGPLGQGMSNAVGMAIAERFLSAQFNKDKFPLVDHYTYVIATDGDMMEGVVAEAASLAGHQGLGKLIVLYDDNKISLAAPTELSFTEEVMKRFEGYGWHVQQVEDGNTDLDGIRAAVKNAKSETDRPSLISIKTIIGFGSPNKANSHAVHGAPLGPEEIKATKENLGWPADKEFFVPDDVLEHYRSAVETGKKVEESWNKMVEAYRKAHPEMGKKWNLFFSGGLADGWEKKLPVFKAEDGPVPTRKASGSVINSLAEVVPNLIGGDADLAPSTNTYMKNFDDQQKNSPGGRNIRFGVREHGMGAAVNGMAYHGGLIPYGGTFLTFSDYMRGAVRISALSRLHTIWIWTHDSVWLGEDGPTHQSVEHLAALRAIPNLTVIRPADANETSQAWKVALQHTHGPVALIFSRQGLPVYDRSKVASAAEVARGGYVLVDAEGDLQVILVATGSEVSLAMEARELLQGEGVGTRVVSLPSWELFDRQDQSYRDSVLPPEVKARVAVEAGVSMGWCKYTGDSGRMVCWDAFGHSAPYKVLTKEFGFTPQRVADEARKAVEQNR